MPGAQKPASVVVLGAGPGGYAAAFRAADLGLDVTLVDPEVDPGGVCLYRGCIPSKALLHVARVMREAEEAAAYGLSFDAPRVDLDRLRAWKDSVVGQLTGGLGTLCKAKGVRFLRGRGVFRDARTLIVDGDGSPREELSFDRAIIATGSRPTTIDGFPDSRRVMTSTAALELSEIPPSLLVVGGGYIGLEIGSVYSALGSRVTVVEMADRMLLGVDTDLVRVLARSIEGQFEAVHLKTRVDSVRETTDAVEVTLVGPDGDATESSYDAVLVAVGRRPNTSGLGLAQTRVEIDDHGFVKVDPSRQTGEPGIFAIGDVAGQPMLAHKATHEGLTAAEACAGATVAFDPAAIPAVVFTDPELAWCGLTEAEARDAGADVKVARFPWQASGRAATLGRRDGLTKLVIDPETERVLGVGIVGVGAGDLIAEGVLAVEMGATAADIALTVHPHPTLSETVMETAEVFRGLSVHLHRKR